jgi:hypothetical protein
MKLLHDNTPSLLIDVYRTLPSHDRADFRETAHDFSCGLNSTIIGAASAMRLWVANPPSWIGNRRQQARIRFLAALDAVMAGQLQSAA